MNYHAKVWVELLKSDTLKQGFGRLHDPDKDTYCALGASLLGPCYSREKVLPAWAVVKLGLFTCSGGTTDGSIFSIVYLNDHLKLSLPAIGKILEENPKRYFV
jgi:hypothetical protein